MGYISDGEAPEHSPKEVIVVDEVLMPGTETDFKGFFCRQLKYLGVKDKNELVFFNGSEAGKHYFTTLFLIHPFLIFEMYKSDSGRDFNWIDNRWK